MEKENLYAQDGFFWWIGCVENRQDPLKLGRCQVRILGYHLNNAQTLPTADLPWAIPLQDITSAAASGIGKSPTGALEGSWVVGFFADGKECQQPVMLGTFAGSSQTVTAGTMVSGSTTVGGTSTTAGNVGKATLANSIANFFRGAVGNPTVPASAATPTKTEAAKTSSNSITHTIGPMNQNQIQSLMDKIGQKESGGKYNITNADGFVGKYQFGAAALQSQGYVTPLLGQTKLTEADLNNPAVWTGKNGITSVNDFLANKNNVQEVTMFNNLNNNYTGLLKTGVLNQYSDASTVAGYLASAHLGGVGGATLLSQGISTADNLGTRTSTYFQLGADAVAPYSVVSGTTGTSGATPASTPAAAAPVAQSFTNTTTPSSNLVEQAITAYTDFTQALNNPALGTPAPFSDPNSIFPFLSYFNRADTNVLASVDSGQLLNSGILGQINKLLVQNVKTANGKGGGTWNEPKPAFNAKYPFNQVQSTTSGHVMEFDDTPNAERIHIYHKTGTRIEIDKNGTKVTKTTGENYEVMLRNNHVSVKGNMDVTVDGAKTLLVKHAMDIEVLGKATINIRNDADLNVAGTFNVKAKNINIEAQQDLNIKTGNYFSNVVGGQLSYLVLGSEDHKAAGGFNVDGAEIALNSGAAHPHIPTNFLLSAIPHTNITGSPFAATGLNVLNSAVANPLSSVGKGLSGILGNLGNAITSPNLLANSGTGFIDSVIANQGVGANGGTGLAGLGSLLGGSSGISLGSLGNILGGSGAGLNLSGLLSGAGVTGNGVFGNNNAGLGALGNLGGIASINYGQNILNNIPTIIGGAIGGVLGNSIGINSQQSKVLGSLIGAGVITLSEANAADSIASKFQTNGATYYSTSIATRITGKAIDDNEFKNWWSFPPSTRLSRYYRLGDVSDYVHEVPFQHAVQDQAGLKRWEIVSNLKALSVNCLDPIHDKYPNVLISDAFRPTTTTIMASQDYSPIKLVFQYLKVDIGDDYESILHSYDQHHRGEAANLHFYGACPEDYYKIATWIRNNIAFDQLRLEYTTLENTEPWISISYNRQQNRPPAAIDKIVTCINGRVVANYLADLTSVK